MPCATTKTPALTEVLVAAAPRSPWYTVAPEVVTYSSWPLLVTSVIVFPLTDCTRPMMVGTSIVIAVAAMGEDVVFGVSPRDPRTATTSPTLIAPKLNCLPSRLYFVEELVVTVTVPVSVRSVSVEPLIPVTVPVSPPQNPPAAEPKPVLVKPLLHGDPKPPRPNDGGCSAPDGPLGDGWAASALASVTDAARVTAKPATAPITAMPSAMPARRSLLLRGCSAGGSGETGGVSQFGGSTFICEDTTIPCRPVKSVTNAPDWSNVREAAEPRLHLGDPCRERAAISNSRKQRLADVDHASRLEAAELLGGRPGPGPLRG